MGSYASLLPFKPIIYICNYLKCHYLPPLLFINHFTKFSVKFFVWCVPLNFSPVRRPMPTSGGAESWRWEICSSSLVSLSSLDGKAEMKPEWRMGSKLLQLQLLKWFSVLMTAIVTTVPAWLTLALLYFQSLLLPKVWSRKAWKNFLPLEWNIKLLQRLSYSSGIGEALNTSTCTQHSIPNYISAIICAHI